MGGNEFGKSAGNFVTDAPNGLNEFLRMSVIDLFTQIKDIDFDRIGEGIIVVSPDLLENWSGSASCHFQCKKSR